MNKAQLKEQAKSLLLKGCYKMASNKYQTLIDLGGQGFSQRQWAVVNLNRAICLLFQQHYEHALIQVNVAIQIDPTYDKAYYRKLQILKQMGQLQEALNCVPVWIHNKEVDQLLTQIKQQYLNSLGLDQLIENLISDQNTKENSEKTNQDKKNTKEMNRIKQSLARFYQRLVNHLQSGEKDLNLKSLGQKICNYYVKLVEGKQSQTIQSLLSMVRSLVIKGRQIPKMQSQIKILLQNFWFIFVKLAQPFQSSQFTADDFAKKQSYKLVKYTPICSQLLVFLRKCLLHTDLYNQAMFDNTLQTISLTESNQSQLGKQLVTIITDFTNILSSRLKKQTLLFLKRGILLADALIKAHLQLDPLFRLAQPSLVSIFYWRYCMLNSQEKEQQKRKALKDMGINKMIQFVANNLDNFLILFLFEQFAHKIDRQITKTLLVSIQDQLSALIQIKKLKKQSSNNKVLLDMQAQFQLIYVSLMLKIDLKQTVSNMDIKSLLHSNLQNTVQPNKTDNKNVLQIDSATSLIVMNTFILLSITNQKHLLQLLKDSSLVLNLLNQSIQQSFIQQVEGLGLLITLVFVLAVDAQQLQQENWATQMGVSVDDIKKAKQIQGEKQQPQLVAFIQKERTKFKQQMLKDWHQLIPNVSSKIINLKQTSYLRKWGKILSQMAKIDCSRLHHPKIIQVMLLVFKQQAQTAGHFFCLLCKKINAGLLKFQTIQSICDVLSFNIQNAGHELVIFESLLGLINLSSNLTMRLKIPINKLVNCLLEQNRYIVHAACELLNNLLIYQPQEEVEKMLNLKTYIEKYLNFYREQINTTQNMPLSDYSHPGKVYPTLLSLAIVLQLDHIYEFQNWSNMQKCILKLQPPRGVSIFKAVMYMKAKNRLPVSWWHSFSKDLTQFRALDPAKWNKLQQYVK